ncbi:MAG: hypothetical protein E4G99_00685 [Anaerolineales bacterium]|nr:MAG: hypothetical protein E4G99_00685 [Anaerolineales bacterium]
MKNGLRVMLLIVLGSLLAACNFSGGPKADKAALSAWIDKPLNKSTHMLGPIEILGHGAAYGEVAQLELSYLYNNEPQRTLIGANAPEIVNIKPGSSASKEAALGRAKWVWIPPTIGTFLLNLRVQRGDGAWSDYGQAKITVIMPDLPIGGLIQPEPGQGPQPGSSPTLPPTVTSTPEPACTNQAKFIADITIPDNTNLAPGAAFTKIWRLQNSGTCTWDENYKVVFIGGTPLSNPTPQSVPGIVAPGGMVDISLANLVAPGSPGTYKSDYQLRSPQNEHFGVGTNGGVPFYVQIVVGATTVPPTAVPTSAPDTQPPSVSISHNPPGAAIPTGNNITFTANASDNVGVTGIDIWITAPSQFPSLVKTCSNTNSCSFTGGPYNTVGNLSYFAIARDAAAHETNSGGHTINIYTEVR